MRKIVRGIAILAVLAIATPVFAQSQYSAGLIVETEKQKVVSHVVEEKVTIQNSEQVKLDPGVLEIIFPQELELQFSSPSWTSYNGNKATWMIPSIDPQSSFVVRYVTLPRAVSPEVETVIEYLVSGASLAQTKFANRIVAVQAQQTNQIKGETLPRTGASQFYLLLTSGLVLLFVLVSARFWRLRTKPMLQLDSKVK